MSAIDWPGCAPLTWERGSPRVLGGFVRHLDLQRPNRISVPGAHHHAVRLSAGERHGPTWRADDGGCGRLARRPPGRTGAAAEARVIRPAAHRGRAARRRPSGHGRACGGRPSPPGGRSRDLPASGPRRRPAPRADPGRPPRGRARDDRHGRSGPGRSSRRRRVARRRAPRRHHPPVAPPFEPSRRVGPPSWHRRRRPLSGAYRRPSRGQPDLDVQAGAVSSSEARSSASSIASSAITGTNSRASSAWVSSDADGSARRSSSS